MNARQLIRLPAQFSPWIALASAAILLAAGIVVSSYQDRLFLQQQLREVTVQGQILAASVSAAVAFDDSVTAQEYVNALKINPEIEAVNVFDAKHALFASFSRNGEQPVLQLVGKHGAWVQNDRVMVIVPITQAELVLGTVYIRALEESPARRLARYIAIMLLAIMAALLLVVLSNAQRALRKVNAELADRAVALADTNRKLQNEMEEREKAEEALRQSQKMEAVGQLSGGVAHDFNNLLSIIKGNLGLMQKRIAQGRVDVQHYIDAANEGVERAANLTKRLLAFSRRQPLSPSAVNLSELARGMTDMIRQSVGENIRIEWKLLARWMTICDINQMENVILNLAINARDAMPDGGTLTIETNDIDVGMHDLSIGQISPSEPGEYVELRVRDTGIGMSDEVRARAVDPFFTTKPQGQGTGLGLSMTFGFIQQSNGSMGIESIPSQGTTIIIRMPRTKDGESKENA